MMGFIDPTGIMTPLIDKCLPLYHNLIDSGWYPGKERIVLNLCIARWPEQYIFCKGGFGDSILGMEIRWIFG